MSIVYTIVAEDIGKIVIPRQCPLCGTKRPIQISSALGRVLRIDIGKQVYDVDGVIQVENDRQRDNRLNRHLE